MRNIPTPVSVILLLALAACQQPASKVTYKKPGEMLAQYPAPEGHATDLSYFPRWNGGNIEMAQGDKSGPVELATAGMAAGVAPSSNATLPVDYQSRAGGGVAATAPAGAGAEASRYYAGNPMGAARVGGAAPAPAPQMAAHTLTPSGTISSQTAPSGSGAHAYAPIPLAPTPFGTPSAPLANNYAAAAPAPVTPAPYAAARPAPAQGMYAPINVPPLGGAPAGSSAAQQKAAANAEFAAFMASDTLTPGAPNDYTGTYALGGAAPLPPATPMAPASPLNGAAPSLPMMAASPAPAPALPAVQQAIAAPVNGSIQSTPVSSAAAAQNSHFVIQASAQEDHKNIAVPAALTSTLPQASHDLVWPVKGTILSKFGPKSGGKSNDGVNIAAPAGTPIHAAADGMVIYAGNELQGYGNMLVISHEGGRSTVYAHAQKLRVKKGDFVHQGQVVANVGQSGGVKEPQLHFALREGSKAIDPMPVLQKSKIASSDE